MLLRRDRSDAFSAKRALSCAVVGFAAAEEASLAWPSCDKCAASAPPPERGVRGVCVRGVDGFIRIVCNESASPGVCFLRRPCWRFFSSFFCDFFVFKKFCVTFAATGNVRGPFFELPFLKIDNEAKYKMRGGNAFGPTPSETACSLCVKRVR